MVWTNSWKIRLLLIWVLQDVQASPPAMWWERLGCRPSLHPSPLSLAGLAQALFPALTDREMLPATRRGSSLPYSVLWKPHTVRLCACMHLHTNTHIQEEAGVEKAGHALQEQVNPSASMSTRTPFQTQKEFLRGVFFNINIPLPLPVFGFL